MIRRWVAIFASTVGAIKKTVVADERHREDVRQARDAWPSWQKTVNPAQLVFIDETGIRTDMIRPYGHAKGGRRCVDEAPGGHWNTVTFIGGLRLECMTAPWCLDGAMTGAAFLTYVDTQRCPILKAGERVIADNLSSHKVAGVRALIEAKGAKLLYIPPYSPALNPIEQAFSKLKSLLRKAKARSFDTLCQTLGKLLEHVAKQECANYFQNAGYEPI